MEIPHGRSFATRSLLHGLLLACAFLLWGCASVSGDDAEPPVMEQPLAGDPGQPKRIMVFLDGTRNDAGSGTNVRKLFEAVSAANDPQTTSVYIEGVGSAETPLLGSGLGFGMEPRILRGYDFVAQAYRAGDEVFIFGFSRGAHSARALAGLLAYAGVPPPSTDDRATRLKRHNRIIEIVKGKNDSDFEAAWRAWRPGAAPIVAKDIGASLKIATLPVEIAFLGVWDTVPGSSFKTFGDCKELADRKDGDRYKSDSYPPIRRIFHAVSLDEKRSKFRQLLLCPALNPAYTELGEVWFPGAHADIGGGYEDSQGLSNVSLQWMTAKLGAAYPPRLATLSDPKFAGDPLGLAHWSIGDRPANLLSECEDRRPPACAIKDPAVAARTAAGNAPVRMHGVIESKPYPLWCAGQQRTAGSAAVAE